MIKMADVGQQLFYIHGTVKQWRSITMQGRYRAISDLASLKSKFNQSLLKA